MEWANGRSKRQTDSSAADLITRSLGGSLAALVWLTGAVGRLYNGCKISNYPLGPRMSEFCGRFVFAPQIIVGRCQNLHSNKVDPEDELVANKVGCKLGFFMAEVRRRKLEPLATPQPATRTNERLSIIWLSVPRII